MKARIKDRLRHSALRASLRRCPRTKKIERKVMAVAMLQAGVLPEKIAWEFAWPVADVQQLVRILERLH